MVVVPTSTDVSLTYGRTPADDVGQAVTLVSVAAVVVLVVVGRRRRRSRLAVRAGAGTTR
jgi:hypothetical protein